MQKPSLMLVSLSAATHDPEIIEWLKDKMRSRKNTIEFGFLKGLADRTKSELSEEGWKVAEYVPYGPGARHIINDGNNT